MQRMKRSIAMLLCAAILLGLAGCDATPADRQAQETQAPVLSGQVSETPDARPQPSGSEDRADQGQSPENENIAPVIDFDDRESLVEIVDLVSGGNVTAEDVEDLDDDALTGIIEDLLEDSADNAGSSDAALPETEDGIAEDGSLEKPLDQIYPEIVEEELVEYSGESLLVKLSNSRGAAISDGMKAAGVAALEVVVPMEETTWYEAKLVKGTDVDAAVEALRALSEILLVDYNYKVQTAAMADYEEIPSDWLNNTRAAEQWYLNYCGIPSGEAEMANPGGSSSVIVAVIDTGVDYDHEDLAGNIWVNSGETPDNNIDDDGNGYVDDYYGVNIVAGSGNGDDDNGHGTHVAGIIAAQNNNLGTVGIAYNVQIMPIKAAMASGYLLQSDIAKAILYAYENGAEVINMSFGGTACSIAVQDALAVAYNRCVLVASAGNNGAPNEYRPVVQPNYPAALSYVLGVMSVDSTGTESSFSNYDVSLYTGREYEIYAPGESILSTIPGDGYASWSGTSMAAPVVSAIAALLRSEYSDRDTYPTKFIYGQIVATSEDSATCYDPSPAGHGVHNVPNVVNLYNALTVMPTPDVGLQDYTYFDTEGFELDTAGANTGDGTIDAGETIALGMTLRNRWGMSKDTIVTIDALVRDDLADPYITIHNPSVNYGSVGTYSTGDCGKIITDEVFTGWENPIYITIAEDCPNDYIFNLNVTITCGNALDEEDTATYTRTGTITLQVRNGKILPTIIEEDMVLTKDNLYIIPDATVIQAGVTVTVEPGTQIQFWSNDPGDAYAEDAIAYLIVKGNLLVEGTPEEMVRIFPSDLMDSFNVELGTYGMGYISLKYADVTNLGFYGGSGVSQTSNNISYAEGCVFRQNYYNEFSHRYLNSGTVETSSTQWFSQMATLEQAKNCVFYKTGSISEAASLYGSLEGCLFADSALNVSEAVLTGCVFQGNQLVDRTSSSVSYNTMVLTNVVDTSRELRTSNLYVYYREETGTTYIRSNGAPYVTSNSAKKEFHVLADALGCIGGGYLIVEDQAELNWLHNQEVLYGDTGSFVGLDWNGGLQCFTWHDGTPLADFFTVSMEGENSSYFQLSGDGTVRASNSYYDRAVYEIPGYVLPEDITFRAYQVAMDMDTSYQITPVSAPAVLDLTYFTYDSSDEAVLTVSDTGLVTPVAPGTADVTVWSLDRAVCNYISFTVTEESVALESITPAAQTAELAVGSTMTMDVNLAPADTTRTYMTFSSADESIATVNAAGVITGVSSGTVVITAACEGLTAQMEVTVYAPATTLDILQIVISAGYMDGTIALPEIACNEGAEVELTWESSDEEVAQITAEGIQIIAPGISAITVTDRRTGLTDACQLIVQETETLVGIRDIVVLGHNHFVLLENGDLYCWSNSLATPTRILTGIAMVEPCSGNHYRFMAVTTDGLVNVYSASAEPTVQESVDTFRGQQIVDLAYYYAQASKYRCYVVLADGRCFAWGADPENALGTGNTTEETPALVNLENVAEVTSFADLTILRTVDGDMYTVGDGLSTSPLYRMSGVACLTEDIYAFMTEDGAIGNFNSGSYSMIDPVPDLAEMDKVAHQGNSYTALAIKDGLVYQWYYSGVEQVPGITNAVDVDVYNDSLYIATADGLVYGFGSYISSSNSFGGAATTNQGSPIVIPLNPLTGDVTLTGTNLGQENVLTEDTLLLSFNKFLTSCGATLWADGEQMTFNYSSTGNEMAISRSAGFEEGVNYEVRISAGAAMAFGGLSNSAEIVVSFTYESAGEAEEAVIHTTVVDETVQRHYTVDSLAEAVNAWQEETQQNYYFHDNAILNQIHTTDDVNSWFRINAHSSGAGEEVPLGQNWWGTTNETLIDLQLVDYTDYPTYARLMYAPYLTEAPATAFPFVTSVTILNKEGEAVTTVGNEEITLRVTFNRDMDPDEPLTVRFGSYYPYGDYEIEGSFVDSRTWEGKYTLSTLIENGQQYFWIDGGQADNGLKHYLDTARFGFIIDTTAAQALIMQGEATDTGIQLSWTQDDFDTLMGYNVYRATSEDGYYQRLNATVIPAETMEFFDDTVEPGVVYYYNFTVVQTDLTESTPSGKISIMSKDTMAPDLYHTPVYTAYTGSNLIISATVTDNLSVTNVKLYYRATGQTTWKVAVMNKLNDKYSAIIPADQLTTAGLEYYIEATDGVNSTYKGSAENPYQITIQEAIDPSSKGDVNGDGKISNLDALMLLQAINDLLNLDSDQFARADLNGDGTLTASEALRILQYVSGTVGDLNMP